MHLKPTTDDVASIRRELDEARSQEGLQRACMAAFDMVDRLIIAARAYEWARSLLESLEQATNDAYARGVAEFRKHAA